MLASLFWMKEFGNNISSNNGVRSIIALVPAAAYANLALFFLKDPESIPKQVFQSLLKIP